MDLGRRGANIVYSIECEYNKRKISTEEYVDILLIIYRVFGNESAFNLLFRLHKSLLISIVNKVYSDYYRHFSDDDRDDLYSMVLGEFYRRVMIYSIPPEAPFSKYIKGYFKKWVRSYAKLLHTKLSREVDFMEAVETGEIK